MDQLTTTEADRNTLCTALTESEIEVRQRQTGSRMADPHPDSSGIVHLDHMGSGDC